MPSAVAGDDAARAAPPGRPSRIAASRAGSSRISARRNGEQSRTSPRNRPSGGDAAEQPLELCRRAVLPRGLVEFGEPRLPRAGVGRLQPRLRADPQGVVCRGRGLPPWRQPSHPWSIGRRIVTTRPGLAVAELDRAMVQPRDRRDEAQAEAAARLRAALFEPDEALQHPLAVGLGNARRRCRRRAMTSVVALALRSRR